VGLAVPDFLNRTHSFAAPDISFGPSFSFGTDFVRYSIGYEAPFCHG